jgi:SAM-dependent methyltransferase
MWCCPKCRSAAEFADPRPWPQGWTCSRCGFALTHRNGIACLGPQISDTAAGFDPALFDILAKFEETSFWFVNRARLIVLLLKRYFPHAGNLLEIGCGTGSVLLALRTAFPQLELAGSELFPQGLEFARKRLNSSVLLLQMDARAIPAISEFDVIGAFDVLEHIGEDERVMRQIYAALKPGGGTIIAVPQHPWLWSPTDDAARHQRRYFRGELESKLQTAGFRIRHSTSFMSLLVPAMIVSRIWLNLKARCGMKLDPLSELQVPAWLNRTFSAIVRLEVALTSAGIKWPLGGSRFVVAQRPG